MRLRKPLLLGLILWLLLAAGAGHAQTPRPSEYQLKAAFLFNFAKFIDWPPEALADDKASFVIGILGDNPFGNNLEQIVAGKKINGHPIVVQVLQSATEAGHCQILFISSSEKKRFAAIILNLHGAAVLTVSDTDQFIESGGMCKRRLKSAAGVMCVTRRFKSAASSLTMKHVSQYGRLDRYTPPRISGRSQPANDSRRDGDALADVEEDS